MPRPRKPRPNLSDEIRAKYELDEIDRRILNLKLQHPGMTDEEIGVILDLHRVSVCNRRTKPAWQAAYAEETRPAADLINAVAEKAAKRYIALLDCDDPRVVEKVARSLLVHANLLKTKDEGGTAVEPLVLVMPMSQETITIAPHKLKELPVARLDDPSRT